MTAPGKTFVEGDMVAKSFHENFRHETVQLPSERSTGLVFAVVAIIVAIIYRDVPTVLTVAGSLAGLLAVTSFLFPKVLKPLNILWFKFGMLLHRFMNPLIMFLMFAIAIVPAGLIMQLFRDPLRSRRTDGETYWVKRDAEQSKSSSMENQF